MKIFNFVKNEAVLCISFVAALLSMFISAPSAAYIEYVDFSVLTMLFCLMAAVCGFEKTGLFKFFGDKLSCAFKGVRTLAAALVILCFFMSMFITNDVVLLTFVPLTISLLGRGEKTLIRVIILETAAANLGSAFTPIGNPQNLYIYSHYMYSMGDFILTMLPISVISLCLILLSLFLVPNEKLEPEEAASKDISFTPSRNFFVYAAVFALCICTVVRVIDYRICLCTTFALVLVFDRKVLAKVDYALLLTFVCFFVFVGNVSSADPIQKCVASLLEEHEMLVSCALSQLISNVPAAVMLSGFVTETAADKLLIGVNIGGMGTLIASLASLISFKLYAKRKEAEKGRYIFEFTLYNFTFLAVLILFGMIIENICGISLQN